MAPSVRPNSRKAFAVFLFALFLMLGPGLPAQAADSGSLPPLPVTGEQWEPAVAADGSGHIYILYPQLGAASDGTAPVVSSIMLSLSADSGATWQPSRALTPPISNQSDPQIVIDPSDDRTVYATWLQNGNRDVIVAKSTDFGQSWSLALATRSPYPVEKPILAVRGKDVYAGFTHASAMWVAGSHDGGISFTFAVKVLDTMLNDALTGNGAVDPSGNVFFAWEGYIREPAEREQLARQQAHLFLSKSPDGKSWATTLMDISGVPAGCRAYHCDWGYLGAQIVMASDAGGTLYALWTSGPVNQSNGAERIYFASSTTSGETWSPKSDLSTARMGVKHVLPTIAARAAGEVRVAWMDSRHSPHWTAYFRTSTSGGAIWSEEETITAEPQGLFLRKVL